MKSQLSISSSSIIYKVLPIKAQKSWPVQVWSRIHYPKIMTIKVRIRRSVPVTRVRMPMIKVLPKRQKPWPIQVWSRIHYPKITNIEIRIKRSVPVTRLRMPMIKVLPERHKTLICSGVIKDSLSKDHDHWSTNKTVFTGHPSKSTHSRILTKGKILSLLKDIF